MLLANLATCLLFYVSSRYRLASAPALIVLAAATLASLFGTKPSRRGVVTTAALVALFLAFTYLSRDASAAIQEANVHYNTGNVWVSRGEHAKAVAEYRRATELDGSRFQTWFNLGSSLAELRRYAEAAAAYGSAAARQPLLFDAHAQRGLMLIEIGDWLGAREALERAEALHPNVFDLQLALGRVAARLGDRQAALHHYDRALAIWPESRAAQEERSRL
jgi:tetratricopeptide (TPR) repeat protein